MVRLMTVLAMALAAGAATAAPIHWSKPTTLSRGITMQTAKVAEPREIRYTAIRIDLRTKRLCFVGSERAPNYGKPLAENAGLYVKQKDGTKTKVEPAVARTRRETVRDFMVRAAKPVAEGGRGLDMVLAIGASQMRPPYDATAANPNGLVLSEGKVVSERGSAAPLFVVRKDGTADIVDALSAAEYPNVQVAVTGWTHLRKAGADIVPSTRNTPGARLAVGVAKGGRSIWILAADDGKTLGYGTTGATYHDLNDAFASLDVPDAVNMTYAAESAVCLRDRKTGAVKTLNLCADKKEPQKCAAAIGVCYRANASPVPAAAATPPPGPEQIEGRIVQARLGASRDKSGGAETTLRGQVRVSVSSDLARFKRPVLYVAAIFDVNGMWRVYDVTCSEQKVSWGHCLDQGQTPAQVSKWQAEVGKEAYATSIYGDPKRGFFCGYHVPMDRVKLLGYRLELWQNGGLVDAYDSDRPALRRLGVPDNWYEKGKHGGKIVYRWPPKESK